MTSKLIDAKQTAEYLGVSVGTLAVWRTNKTYPIPYVKVGSLIKYRLEEVEKWLDERTRNRKESSQD